MASDDSVEFLHHVPCGGCGSSDAGGLYSDGHVYCHRCGHYEAGDGSAPRTKRNRKMAAGLFVVDEIKGLPKRGLEMPTCQKFGYGMGQNRDGKACQIAPYRDDEGEVVAQKIRFANKEFTTAGDMKNAGLFGQHLWKAGGRRIVVTEGEIDAMSVCQAFGLTWAAVSIPNGSDGAAKSIKKALEFLNSYDEVVLCFDMDEPGRKAAAECAPLFPPGKCKIASLPLKDANEMLVASRVDELRSAIYEAKVYRPDGIVTLGEIRARVLASPEIGRPWCIESMNAKTFGRRPGDLHGLGGGTGCGKTDFFTQQITFDVMQLGLTVGVLMLEQGVGETGRRIAGKIAGKRFHIPDGTWTQGELEAAWDGLEETGRLHLYDSWGAMDWATVKAKIVYMIVSLGCQHIFLDHLTALAAAEDDERTALERIMAEMAGIAQAHGAVVHFISHLATPEGKSHEEGGRVMAKHFKGSRAIQFWCHGMWGLERDTQAEDPEERSTTVLRCLKDRFTGKANGETWRLGYDDTKGLLIDKDADLPF